MNVRLAIAAVLLASLCQPVAAGALRERIAERLEQRRADDGLDGGDVATRALPLPSGARVLHDLAYGSDPAQRMDVYIPAGARSAPVIFMVHGGGWRIGDKTHSRVVDNKVARWLPMGVIFASINYRMLPGAEVPTQLDDVAAALSKAQSLAPSWGGDAGRFVLMGHSAGAHLIALLAATPRDDSRHRPWLGSVLLDSAALDVERIMTARHFSLYDQAFGRDAGFWRRNSPIARLAGPTAPWLAVCSSRRDDSCDQAQAFAARATELGARAEVLPEDLSHGDINGTLGQPGAYTDRVDAFLRSVGVLAR
ncbi:MAG TPA: alpha/beta hydrolase [Methyloversatilis sp.]